MLFLPVHFKEEIGAVYHTAVQSHKNTGGKKMVSQPNKSHTQQFPPKYTTLPSKLRSST